MMFVGIAIVKNKPNKIKLWCDFILGMGVGLSIGALWTIAALIACAN